MSEEGEEATVGEILEGLVNPNFISQRLPLLEMLTNKLAEETTTVDKETSERMFKILFNILQKTSCQHPMGRKVVNMANCTLSNATVKEEAVTWFLELTNPEDSECYKQLHFCINKYLDYNPQLEDETTEGEEWASVDEWQHFGNALCNLCQTEQGRRLLLKQSSGYMEKIVKQVRFHQLMICNNC